MNRLIFFFILFAATYVKSSQAQSGYLGSKTAVYVTGDISSYQQFSRYALPWRKSVGVLLSRTINRNVEISIGGQVTRGGMFPKITNGNYIEDRENMKKDNMVGYGGRIAFKSFIYRSGAIAPIGPYWGIELSADYFEVNDVFRTAGMYSWDEDVMIDYNLAYFKAQFWFKFGWQTIIGEHFLVGGEFKGGSIPIIYEFTDTGSKEFWRSGRSVPVIDIFTDNWSESGIIGFEKGKSLFVPEVHVGILF